jgi:hypothetical protein
MRHYKLVSLLVMSLLALVLTGAAPPKKNAATASPNVPKRVLLISIDTLRPDYLSCYGNQRVQTPYIDALSQNGTTMDHAVAQIPLTLPSHASMLTGLYPTHHGVHDNGGFYLNPKLETVAEMFKAQGFATAGFIAGFPLDSRFRIDQGFDYYDDSLPVRAINQQSTLYSGIVRACPAGASSSLSRGEASRSWPGVLKASGGSPVWSFWQRVRSRQSTTHARVLSCLGPGADLRDTVA